MNVINYNIDMHFRTVWKKNLSSKASRVDSQVMSESTKLQSGNLSRYVIKNNYNMVWV